VIGASAEDKSRTRRAQETFETVIVGATRATVIARRNVNYDHARWTVGERGKRSVGYICSMV